MTFLDYLPEVYRYARTELRKTRLLVGFLTVTAICLTIVLSVSRMEHVSSSGDVIVKILFGLQAVVWLVYGMRCVSVSVVQERVNRTWDFQRLTPLSSFRIATGKLLGAPLFPFFLGACVFPWILGFAILDPAVGKGWLASWYLRTVTGLFFFLSLCLLGSAYVETRDEKSSNSVAQGAVLIFVVFVLPQLIVGMIKVDAFASGGVRYFHTRWSVDAFWTLTAVFFGLWLFLGAKWKIGEDLLERDRVWRLPLFLGCLAVYLHGLSPDTLAPQVLVPAGMAYVSVLVHTPGLDHWRSWWTRWKGRDRIHRTPTGITAFSSLLLIFLFFAAFAPFAPFISAPCILAFALRDFAFIQWCRFTRSRHPEVVAFVYLFLAYLIPWILLAAFQKPEWIFLIAPYVPSGVKTPVLDCLPGLLQAAVMIALVARKLRRGVVGSQESTVA